MPTGAYCTRYELVRWTTLPATSLASTVKLFVPTEPVSNTVSLGTVPLDAASPESVSDAVHCDVTTAFRR